MPRYYFDVEDGKSFPDPEGCELPDLDAARIEAVRLLGGIMRDEAESFWCAEDWRMSVTGTDKAVLFTIGFTASMAPALQHMPPPVPGRFAGTLGGRLSDGGLMPVGI